MKGAVKRTFILISTAWFLVNLIQALFTDVIPDEAYYYFYSTNLSWGYFDHPPLVALLISISSLIFNYELGLRFMTVLLQIPTLFVIWKTIDEKEPSERDVYTFFGISASIVMFAVYGFITTSDSPLLFFTALFLYGYNRFLKNESFINCLILTVSMAGLIYSKYQGALIIVLVVLSNLKLLTNTRFWLSGIAAITLLIPHILWQISNDFPSFRYHTTGRAKPFKIGYFLEYLPNQMANFNPFVLPVVAYIMYKFKPRELFTRALYFIIGGIILIFWITTFRGHAEPQWTIAAAVAMIILLYHSAKESEKIGRYIRRFVFPSIILLFILRVILVCDFLPFKLEFYGQRKWSQSIKTIVGERAVVFGDGYQRPSTYMFYAGGDALTVSSIFYRQNQYDLGSYDSKFFGREVAVITGKDDPLAEKYPLTKKDTLYVRFSDHLVLTSKVDIEFNLPDNSVLEHGESKDISILIKNNYALYIPFEDPEYPVTIHSVFIRKDKIYSVTGQFVQNISGIEPDAQIVNSIRFEVPADIEPGEYKFMISLKTSPFREGFNSKTVSVTLK